MSDVTGSIGAGEALAPGTMVGEYEIQAEIGHGGFGSVFRAVHPVIGKVVAVKVLHRRFSVQPRVVGRFINEARAVNQIRHRNIVDIFGFGRLDDGRHYCVMAYLDGVTLERYLDDHGRLSLADTIAVVRPVARALSAAHANGIAHRDLKTDNVFLARDTDGAIEPMLLDFGIAKLLGERRGESTKSGMSLGTPAYMSPEQSLGEAIDHRTDIYAFGIMLYRMLTGTVPFDDDNHMRVLLAQVNDSPCPPSALVADLPDTIDAYLARLLAKEPADRPPDMQTAVAELEGAARTVGVTVPDKRDPIQLELDCDQADAPIARGPGLDVANTRTVQVAPGEREPERRSSPAGAGSVSVQQAETVALDSRDPDAAIRPGAAPRRNHRLLVALGLLAACAAGGAVYHASESGAAGGAADRSAISSDERLAVGAERDIDNRAADERPAVMAGRDIDNRAADERPAGVAGRDIDNRAADERALAPPALVAIRIEGAPDGTEVYGPRGLLGTAPGVIQLARRGQPVVLTFRASGFQTATRTVVPAADAALQVTLERAAAAAGKARVRRARGDRAPNRTGPNRGARSTSVPDRDALNALESPF